MQKASNELATWELDALVLCGFPKYGALWCPHGPMVG